MRSEGQKLLLEAKRTTTEHLPVYNEQQVRIVSREVRQLWEQIEALTTQIPEAPPPLLSRHEQPTITSNKNINGDNNSSSTLGTTPQQQLKYQGSTLSSSQQQQQMLYSSQTGGGGGGDDDAGEYDIDDGTGTHYANPEAAAAASYGAELLLYQLTIHQNKRILMAYHHRRLDDYLVPLLWSFHGSVSLVPPQARDRMSHTEREFMSTYSKNLQSYQSQLESAYSDYDIDLELTHNIEHPPRELFIEVRVVQDCGQVQTEFGTVNLEKGSQHFLRRADVEHLIAQGYLQHVN
ncbi:DNA replication protein psf1 [Mycoemilia scoparia]|uniref:DNA replication complex GINS protein PSF1 n=1 Tax=Mycoemilia scoparia TaxID=417184 RepID=A0A9W8DPP2_9FUNG|nr:DNA replication protein psf1 [Mycoemilia scoparia]